MIPINQPHFRDFTGQKIGRWTVISYSHSQRGAYWKCQCDCGKVRLVRGSCLGNHSESCGCLYKETHRLSKSTEYSIWHIMRQRCENPKSSHYSLYGGRGITVVPRWSKFENFYADLGPRPSPQHEIDRRDNDGPYSPENCRWVTRKEQMNNCSKNRLIFCNGKTKTLSQWAQESGIAANTIRFRLNRAWPTEKAIFHPLRLTSRQHGRSSV